MRFTKIPQKWYVDKGPTFREVNANRKLHNLGPAITAKDFEAEYGDTLDEEGRAPGLQILIASGIRQTISGATLVSEEPYDERDDHTVLFGWKEYDMPELDQARVEAVYGVPFKEA